VTKKADDDGENIDSFIISICSMNQQQHAPVSHLSLYPPLRACKDKMEAAEPKEAGRTH